MCEFIIWLHDYIKRNQDRIVNSQKCKKLNYPKGVVESIDGITDFYHISDKYCIEAKLVEKLGVAGKTVKVIKSLPNPNKNINFPYLAIRVLPENGSK